MSHTNHSEKANGTTRDKVENLTSWAADETAAIGDNLKDKAQEITYAVQDQFNEAKDDVAEFIKANPYKSAAIAFALGWLTGKLL